MTSQTEIWSVNIMQQDKYLSSKIVQKMGRETSFKPLFVFLIPFIWGFVPQVICSLVSIYFNRPQLDIQKTTTKKQTV